MENVIEQEYIDAVYSQNKPVPTFIQRALRRRGNLINQLINKLAYILVIVKGIKITSCF